MKRLMSFGLPALIPEIIAAAKGLVPDFRASDATALDIICGNAKSGGNLPFELPSTMEVVRTQRSVL